MDETGYTCAASAFSTDIIDFKVPGETVCALMGLGSGTNSGCEERTEQGQTFDEWLKDVKETCYANMECCDEPEWSLFSTINDAIELYRSGKSGYGCKAIDHTAEEERRDVARKLRKLSNQEEVSKMDVRQTVGLYMGSCRKGYSPESVLRLADLIEPEPERTCKREKLYDAGGEWYEGCSKCRNPLSEHDVFCSKCGAKVVEP